MSALRLHGVCKSFAGSAVLDGVTLDVPEGGVTAILGPSGCGKTTLLRLVAGFLRVDGGSIDIGGKQVSGPSAHVPPEARRQGYLAQEGALFPHLTVAQNIAFGLPRRDRRDARRLSALLGLVSLDGALAGRYPDELSGGQQQRVALARTLAPAPRLVLLDEPFSALDASLRTETRGMVATALAAADVTTVLVTHDQGEALSFADRVAVMRSGRLAQVGEPQQVYDDPADLPTADFLGDTCTIRGVVRGGVAHGPLGDIEVRYPPGGGEFDGPALLMLRPEQLRIRPVPDGRPGPSAVVRAVEYFGHDCVVTADLPGDPPTTVTSRVLGGDRVPPGTPVRVTVSGTALAYPVPR